MTLRCEENRSEIVNDERREGSVFWALLWRVNHVNSDLCEENNIV